MAVASPPPSYASPVRAAGSTERALLVFRWVSVASVLVNLLLNPDRTAGRNPQLALLAVAAVAGWTLYLARRGAGPGGPLLAADVLVGAGLLLLSGYVMPAGTVATGATLLSVTYPLCAVLSAGAAYGPMMGIAAGAVMAGCQLAVRAVNGVPLTGEVLQRQWPSLTGFVLLGFTFGIVANLLRRSSEQVQQATAEAIAAREREARLAERESMARQIHDSVLQVLALIHKRGIELAEGGAPSARQVRELAELARDQEAALRGLILREPDEPAQGEASLRTALEAAAREIREVEVSVSAVGPVRLPAAMCDELVAAVKEALANVCEHAKATKAVVFADEADGSVMVSVRDDGVGFEFDEDRFRHEGKFGVLNSMRGRVEALGGRMSLDSRIGSGTEVEFVVPVDGQVDR